MRPFAAATTRFPSSSVTLGVNVYVLVLPLFQLIVQVIGGELIDNRDWQSNWTWNVFVDDALARIFSGSNGFTHVQSLWVETVTFSSVFVTPGVHVAE